MAREYKDSGIAWIGRIPKDWKVCRIKDIFQLRTGTTPKGFEQGLDLQELVNWFTPSDVAEMNCELSSSERHLSKEVIEKEGIELSPAGSLIFVGIGASAGKIGYATVEGYSNQQITTLIPKQNKCFGKYSYYYMIADGKRIRDNAFYTTLPIINNSYLSGVKSLLPPLAEQQAIASYLDTKCAEIDSLVELQEQMIAQLTDYKQSVITEAVTKGLNPEAELVPSGIDWIGDIPKGWRVCRFKSYISLVKEKVDNIDLPKINLENIESYSGKFIETDSKYDGEGYLFKPGDVLFGKLRPYLAKVFAPDYKGQAVGDFYVFRPSSKIETNFLKYAILSDSFISNVNSSTYGTKMPRANWDFISNVYIAIPPLEEQQTIITYLDAKCREIDSLIDLKRQKIEALKDYKKSIIFEAVTGKTD